MHKTYIGETNHRVVERIRDHSGRDKNSIVYRHYIMTSHGPITMADVQLIAKGFKFEEQRELSETFLIKEQKPTLNIQNLFKSLKLFT